MRSTFQHI